ncbi:hypothetical protein D3C75_735990 [compost metagenome]
MQGLDQIRTRQDAHAQQEEDKPGCAGFLVGIQGNQQDQGQDGKGENRIQQGNNGFYSESGDFEQIILEIDEPDRADHTFQKGNPVPEQLQLGMAAHEFAGIADQIKKETYSGQQINQQLECGKGKAACFLKLKNRVPGRGKQITGQIQHKRSSQQPPKLARFRRKLGEKTASQQSQKRGYGHGRIQRRRILDNKEDHIQRHINSKSCPHP